MASAAETAKALFHYTRASTAIDKILASMTLRMGPLESTNDPMETQRLHVRVLGERNLSPEELDRFLADNIILQRTMMSACRLICLTHEEPVVVQGMPGEMRVDIGLPGFGHDRMWGQYAEGHSGVCLFFPKDKLTRAIEDHFAGRDDEGKLIHGPVNDFAKVPRIGALKHAVIQKLGVPAVAWGLRGLHADKLFFSKSFDWIGEQEYRYVWVGDLQNYHRDQELIPIGQCLGAICLGRRFPKERDHEIRAIAADIGVPVYTIGVSDDGGPAYYEVVNPKTAKHPPPAIGVARRGSTPNG